MPSYVKLRINVSKISQSVINPSRLCKLSTTLQSGSRKLSANHLKFYVRSNFEPILLLFHVQSTDMKTKTRHDFAQQLYTACMSPDHKSRIAVTLSKSTWFPFLQQILKNTSPKDISKSVWIEIIAHAIQKKGIEWIPGTESSHISWKPEGFVKLTGQQPLRPQPMARPGTTASAVNELQRRQQELAHQRTRRIDFAYFGCSMSFNETPRFLREAFKRSMENIDNSEKKDLMVREHYHHALECLGNCIAVQHPHCDLMLILALTLASSSETPYADLNKETFITKIGKNRDKGQFAAAVVMRMLWFLLPDQFPEKNTKTYYGMTVMATKVEQKGANNKTMLLLGWVRQKSKTARLTPRTKDLELESSERLEEIRSELMSLRKNADGFIRRVFRMKTSKGQEDKNNNWVERCSSIIKG